MFSFKAVRRVATITRTTAIALQDSTHPLMVMSSVHRTATRARVADISLIGEPQAVSLAQG